MLRRGQDYSNCRRMAANTLVQQFCREEDVEFVGLFCWGGGGGRTRDH